MSLEDPSVVVRRRRRRVWGDRKSGLVQRTHTLRDVVPPLDLADRAKDTRDGVSLDDAPLLSDDFRAREHRKVVP